MIDDDLSWLAPVVARMLAIGSPVPFVRRSRVLYSAEGTLAVLTHSRIAVHLLPSVHWGPDVRAELEALARALCRDVVALIPEPAIELERWIPAICVGSAAPRPVLTSSVAQTSDGCCGLTGLSSDSWLMIDRRGVFEAAEPWGGSESARYKAVERAARRAQELMSDHQHRRAPRSVRI